MSWCIKKFTRLFVGKYTASTSNYLMMDKFMFNHTTSTANVMVNTSNGIIMSPLVSFRDSNFTCKYSMLMTNYMVSTSDGMIMDNFPHKHSTLMVNYMVSTKDGAATENFACKPIMFMANYMVRTSNGIVPEKLKNNTSISMAQKYRYNRSARSTRLFCGRRWAGPASVRGKFDSRFCSILSLRMDAIAIATADEEMDYFATLPNEILAYCMGYLNFDSFDDKIGGYTHLDQFRGTCSRINEIGIQFIIDTVNVGKAGRDILDTVVMISEVGEWTIERFLTGSKPMAFETARSIYHEIAHRGNYDIKRVGDHVTIREAMFVVKPRVTHYMKLVPSLSDEDFMIVKIMPITPDTFTEYNLLPTCKIRVYGTSQSEFGLDYMVMQHYIAYVTKRHNRGRFIKLFLHGRLPLRTPDEFAAVYPSAEKDCLLYRRNYNNCMRTTITY